MRNFIIARIIRNPRQYFAKVLLKFPFLLSDKQYLKTCFMYHFGYSLDLRNPKTFSEKLQWLKLYDRNPQYTIMVDKHAVKQYVAEQIGEEYVIPTLGVWDKPEDIDWETLPSQFVLKTTHGGGGNGVIICTDKKKLDKDKTIRNAKKALKADLYKSFREWPYKNVPKRIIAEKFMAPEKKTVPADLPDYKFFCFDGEPRYCQVIRDRHAKETIDFYDMDWIHQEFVGLNPVVHNGLTPVARPENLDEMKDICRKLAKDRPFVRVDLYLIDGKGYFGELTFYPASGLGAFTPLEWNFRLEDLINLPNAMGGKFTIINGEIKELKKEYDDLKDFKFFCFNGMVKFFKVDFGRFVEHHANYYDTDGHLLPFGEKGLEPKPDYPIELPSNLIDMINLAEQLSSGIPFLRVDFYSVKGKIYFGELTFYPASGLVPFTPQIWNKSIGDMLFLKSNE